MKSYRELHAEMLPLMQKAGLKKFEDYLVGAQELGPDYEEELRNFLQSLYDNEYREMSTIWNSMHITDEIWANYKLFGIHGLPEQKILNQCVRDVKAAYRVFRKVRLKYGKGWQKRPKKDPAPESCRSEEDGLEPQSDS